VLFQRIEMNNDLDRYETNEAIPIDLHSIGFNWLQC
jgi:hypothetical protein